MAESPSTPLRWLVLPATEATDTPQWHPGFTRPPRTWPVALDAALDDAPGHTVLVVVDRRRALSRGAFRWWRWYLSPVRAADDLSRACGAELVDVYLTWPSAEKAKFAFQVHGAGRSVSWARRARVLGGGGHTLVRRWFSHRWMYDRLVRAFAPLILVIGERNPGTDGSWRPEAPVAPRLESAAVRTKGEQMLRSIKRFVVRNVLRSEAPPFVSSDSYWDQRYLSKGTSGAGSYGRLAEFKAEVVNRIVANIGADSVVEWGSGDGAQLELFDVPNYLGIDVSAEAVRRCRVKFAEVPDRNFLTVAEVDEGQPIKSDLSLSLDVIYHLVEDETFDSYMRRLFDSGRYAVIVYSSNYEDDGSTPSHMRHRRFTDWVDREAPEWSLAETIPNRYPFECDNQTETSFADFFVFTPSASSTAT